MKTATGRIDIGSQVSAAPSPLILLSILLLLFALGGCSSSSVRLESTPIGAEVHWIRPGETKRSLGKTPITLDSRVHPDVFSGASVLELSLAEHLSESFVVPSSLLPMRTTVAASLRPIELPEACTRQTAAAGQIARGIAEAQSLIVRRDYSQAEALLRNLSETFPQVAVIYDLLGNLYYLRKDVKKALQFYRRSNEVEPNNAQTTRMIDKLAAIKGEVGGTRPGEGE